ncbi:hypothetical protein M3Y95_00824900 [Aphelenchoides besseyi]|nr:hypothetical protein M3Y95_00824900 [Aphelenchoides besseyi]
MWSEVKVVGLCFSIIAIGVFGTEYVRDKCIHYNGDYWLPYYDFTGCTDAWISLKWKSFWPLISFRALTDELVSFKLFVNECEMSLAIDNTTKNWKADSLHKQCPQSTIYGCRMSFAMEDTLWPEWTDEYALINKVVAIRTLPDKYKWARFRFADISPNVSIQIYAMGGVEEFMFDYYSKEYNTLITVPQVDYSNTTTCFTPTTAKPTSMSTSEPIPSGNVTNPPDEFEEDRVNGGSLIFFIVGVIVFILGLTFLIVSIVVCLYKQNK